LTDEVSLYQIEKIMAGFFNTFMGFILRRKTIIPVLAAALLFGAGFLFFRPPVLILTDAPFMALYGQRRVQLRQIQASLALLRLVRPVFVAEGAGPDMILFAIEAVSSRPYCVIFPLRYAGAAERYAGQFPSVISVLLENAGAAPGIQGLSRGAERPAGAGRLRVIRTDRKTDFFRAGLCAGIIGGGGQGRVPLFLDRYAASGDREAFSGGLEEGGTEISPVFFSSASFPDNFGEAACMVFAGSNAEILEKNPQFPLILFTWLDPALCPRGTFLVFDDSPWALAAPAVKTARGMEAAAPGGDSPEKEIPSKVLIFSNRITDKDILRSLKKAARRDFMP
jgi:hypothetical protein